MVEFDESGLFPKERPIKHFWNEFEDVSCWIVNFDSHEIDIDTLRTKLARVFQKRGKFFRSPKEMLGEVVFEQIKDRESVLILVLERIVTELNQLYDSELTNLNRIKELIEQARPLLS